LLGIDRLASVFGTGEGWGGYELQTGAELEAAADLVSALYAKMSSPEEFNLLTLLYFAAMSFTETAWRLGKKEMADGFLLTNLRRFSSERSRICAMARNGGRIRRETIEEIIEPLDIAGLSDWTRRNWYPVNLNDLMSNGDKVGASSEDLRSLFRKLKLNIAE
jgi:FADH2 O2-dependent halogenase